MGLRIGTSERSILSQKVRNRESSTTSLAQETSAWENTSIPRTYNKIARARGKRALTQIAHRVVDEGGDGATLAEA